MWSGDNRSACLYGTLLLFFFFQAEDGIRDYKVTGVQTCALPIFDTLNGNQSAPYSSAGSFNPEATVIFPLQDGAHQYTIKIVPYQPAGETPHEIGRASCRERV